MVRRALHAVGAGVEQATAARDARDRLAAMGEVASTFSDFRPQAEVIQNVQAVPTIFPWYDHATGVGGQPTARFTLVHGPSNEGKTEFCLGLMLSFLQRYHFAGLVDAERTTTAAWVQDLFGQHANHPGFSALPVGTYEQVRAGVRDYCEKIATARETGKVPKETTGIIVVDSIRKLFPKKLWDELAKLTAEDDGEQPRGKFAKRKPKGIDGIGGRAGQIKAAFNAAWVDELIPLLADTRMAMVVIARETDALVEDMFATQQDKVKIGGGAALRYEASLEVRITRDWLRSGDNVIGEKHRLEVWKTKVAGKDVKVPTAWFHTANGVAGYTGFDWSRDLVMLGLEIGAIDMAGGWVKMGKHRLGQGVDNAVLNVRKDEGLATEVEAHVRATSAKTYTAATLL